VNPPLRLYMTMPPDGFIAGPGDRAGQELGRDGGRLFNWKDDRMSDVPGPARGMPVPSRGARIRRRRGSR
jgi:hypothetical protein